jgi:hypothetical protein
MLQIVFATVVAVIVYYATHSFWWGVAAIFVGMWGPQLVSALVKGFKKGCQ